MIHLRLPEFALASLDLYAPDDDYFINFVHRRQADLVWGSFGHTGPDEQTLIVATAVEDPNSDLAVGIRRWVGDNFYTTTTPAYEFEKRGGHGICNHLRLIRLMPFLMDEDKLQSA